MVTATCRASSSVSKLACTASALFAAAELHHYKGRGLNRGGRSAFDQLVIVEGGFFRFIARARDGYDATIRGDEPPSPMARPGEKTSKVPPDNTIVSSAVPPAEVLPFPNSWIPPLDTL